MTKVNAYLNAFYACGCRHRKENVDIKTSWKIHARGDLSSCANFNFKILEYYVCFCHSKHAKRTKETSFLFYSKMKPLKSLNFQSLLELSKGRYSERLKISKGFLQKN